MRQHRLPWSMDDPDYLRWIHGRAEWRRSLPPHNPSRRDVNELGARTASALWAEADSPRYWIRQRCLDRFRSLVRAS